ncbi:hypothetical protein [Clostridium sp. 'White wine YQ']|nr:hypothetical protein [Clostridium sp. 'White wine YQ']MDD7793195.1 hypothetical protein [Clostridium sp. 'White wine YQ']
MKQQDVQDISEVFYAGIYANKKLHVSRKSKEKIEKHGQYGIE